MLHYTLNVDRFSNSKYKRRIIIKINEAVNIYSLNINKNNIIYIYTHNVIN